MDSRYARAAAVLAAIGLLSLGVSGVGETVFPVLSRIGPAITVAVLVAMLLLSRDRESRKNTRTDVERSNEK